MYSRYVCVHQATLWLMNSVLGGTFCFCFCRSMWKFPGQGWNPSHSGVLFCFFPFPFFIWCFQTSKKKKKKKNLGSYTSYLKWDHTKQFKVCTTIIPLQFCCLMQLVIDRKLDGMCLVGKFHLLTKTKVILNPMHHKGTPRPLRFGNPQNHNHFATY